MSSTSQWERSPGIAKNIKTEMNEVLENPVLKQEEKMKVYNQSLDHLLTYDQQLPKPRLSTIVPPHPPPTPQQQESQMDALVAEDLFIWGLTSLSTLYRSYHDG